MTIRLSTGLKDVMMDACDVALANGRLDIYSGSQPATADAAESGTLLVSLTESSGAFTPGSATNGLNFDSSSDGTITKASGETWSGVAVATGTAGYFVFYDNDVDTGASATAVRFMGSIATSGADLNMTSTTINSGGTITLDSGELSLPV